MQQSGSNQVNVCMSCSTRYSCQASQ